MGNDNRDWVEYEQRRELARLREGISALRLHLQIARIFVEGKSLVPDAAVLMAIDHTLAKTKVLEP